MRAACPTSSFSNPQTKELMLFAVPLNSNSPTYFLSELIFTLPFPTVIHTEGQENQQMINGGNYVKNIMSFFTIFALFSLLFSGEWRKHVLPLALLCSYLFVLALSNFAHSERFHLPALPFVMMFAAYGVSLMQNKHKRWFNIWCIVIFVIGIAWSWFKLAGKGYV